MKAVLTDDRFSDPDWIYERKLDGIRCLGVQDDGGVRLLSRNNLSLNDRFPEMAEALGRDRVTSWWTARSSRSPVLGRVSRGCSSAASGRASLPLRVRPAPPRRT